MIKIEAGLVGKHIHISVSDEGVGLSEEERMNLFNKEIRSSHLGTKGEMGTGFGLGIVKNYVDLYGGKIWVSQNFPKGTVFKVELPAYESRPAHP